MIEAKRRKTNGATGRNLQITAALFALALSATFYLNGAYADVTVELSDAIKNVVDPNTQGQIQDLVNTGLRNRARDSADARDLLANNQTIKIICYGEPKAIELGIKTPEGFGQALGGYGDTRGDFDANGKPKSGGTAYIAIDCERLRQIGWFKTFEGDIEKQTMWNVLVHELLHASNRSRQHTEGADDLGIYQQWVDAFNATLREEIRRAEQPPPRRRRQAAKTGTEHSLLVPNNGPPGKPGTAGDGMLARGPVDSCNIPAAEVTAAAGEQGFSLSGSGTLFIDPQNLAAISTAGADAAPLNIEGTVSGISQSGESRGIAAKVAVADDLSSLPLLGNVLSSGPHTNVGGVWSDLDAKTTPRVTESQQNGSFRLDDVRLAIGSGFTATSSGGERILSNSILLMIPSVHINEKSNPEIPLLPFWAPTGAWWQKYRDDLLAKITPKNPQVMIDAKFHETSSQQIAWWPDNLLDEALKKIPNAGAVSSLDTFSLSPFIKFGATDVSSWLANADCLKTFSSGALYTEADAIRGVAPAPGLDPAFWPSAQPPSITIVLEELAR